MRGTVDDGGGAGDRSPHAVGVAEITLHHLDRVAELRLELAGVVARPRPREVIEEANPLAGRQGARGEIGPDEARAPDQEEWAIVSSLRRSRHRVSPRPDSRLAKMASTPVKGFDSA